MKQSLLFILLFVLVSCQNVHEPRQPVACWSEFQLPQINFINQAEDTEGWRTLNRLIPCQIEFVKELSLEVLKSLYFSPTDSIPDVRTLNYYLRDVRGIGAKWGAPPTIGIFYSSRWVERIAEQSGCDEQVLFETRGVMLHELAHAFQLEPQGIGGYNDGGEFWILVEGVADAVRIYNGGFPPDNRRPGGNWTDGFQRTGYFIIWLMEREPDFLRKLNRSTLEVIPWGFDKAIKHILGEEYCIDALWEEYQAAIS